MTYPYQSIIDTAVLPSICDLGPLLNLMTGVFRVWLSHHFSDASLIVNTLLKDKIWNVDPALTKIAIEAHASYDVRLTEFRPAITIKRQKWQKQKIGIGDGRKMGEISEDGVEHYVRLWQGAHTIFCMAASPAEAEALGTEVFEELDSFSQPVRRALNLQSLEVAEIDGYGKLDESGKNFVVPINVSYALLLTRRVVQEAPFLKSLDLTILMPEG